MDLVGCTVGAAVPSVGDVAAVDDAVAATVDVAIGAAVASV